MGDVADVGDVADRASTGDREPSLLSETLGMLLYLEIGYDLVLVHRAQIKDLHVIPYPIVFLMYKNHGVG